MAIADSYHVGWTQIRGILYKEDPEMRGDESVPITAQIG
jgi:hypothetical protein